MIFTLLSVFHSFERPEYFSHPKYKRRGERDPDPFDPSQWDGPENGTTEVDYEYLSHDNCHSHGEETFAFEYIFKGGIICSESLCIKHVPEL